MWKAQPVILHGKLKVDGIKMVDEKGQPLALHGMSFGGITCGQDFIIKERT